MKIIIILMALVTMALLITGCATTVQDTEQQEQAQDTAQEPVPEQQAEQPAEEPATETSTFSAAEVATHSTRDDCWIVISGKVYDATGMVSPDSKHPKILGDYCGKDVTELFETRPMGSNTAHSDRARGIADGLYKGDLAGEPLEIGIYVKPEETQEAATEEPAAKGAEPITKEVLAAHNLEDDCWIAFEGEVFDITAWIPKHPGGKFISKFCGTAMEFENAFINKHARTKVELLKKEGALVGELSAE